MVDKAADYFEEKAKGIGLSVKLPRPDRAQKRVFGLTNGLVGLALLVTGAVLAKPAVVLLGGLGIAGAAVLLSDK